jgi:hypothetical protein
MSHVVTIDCEIKDLGCLEKAAKNIGLEFVRDQHSYKWWGHSVGDYPVPAGFSEKDLGKCDHALRVPGNKNAYEVGVVKSRTAKSGYTLLYDFFGGGYGLEAKVGSNASNLIQNYQLEVAKKNIPFGFEIRTTTLKDGTIELEAVKN